MTLVWDKKWERLNTIFQAQHWIAWFDLDYGGNPEGIFTAACPPKPLLALENGIFLHMLKELFNVILNSKKIKGILNVQVYKWNSYPTQHCMHSHNIDEYPRLLYISGISKITNITVEDKVGIIFCIIILSLQMQGKVTF